MKLIYKVVDPNIPSTTTAIGTVCIAGFEICLDWVDDTKMFIIVFRRMKVCPKSLESRKSEDKPKTSYCMAPLRHGPNDATFPTQRLSSQPIYSIVCILGNIARY